MKRPSKVQLEYWEGRLKDYGLGMERGYNPAKMIYAGGAAALEGVMYPRDGDAADDDVPRVGKGRRIQPQVQRFLRDNHGPVTR